MSILIKDNTMALEALKTKAQSLPNKSDGDTGSGDGITTNGYDTSDATASPSNVLSPYTFYNADGKQTGTMTNKGSLSQTITSNGTQSYDAGWYSGGTITVNVPTGSGNTNTVSVATPTININTSGQITATVNQSAGTTSGGTQTATAWLSDDYDTDFVSSNIKSGVTIFGVQGTYTGSDTSPEINVSTNGTITAGNSTVKLGSNHDSDFVASNIKSGVTIFGTTGTYSGDTSSGGLTELNISNSQTSATADSNGVVIDIYVSGITSVNDISKIILIADSGYVIDYTFTSYAEFLFVDGNVDYCYCVNCDYNTSADEHYFSGNTIAHNKFTVSYTASSKRLRIIADETAVNSSSSFGFAMESGTDYYAVAYGNASDNSSTSGSSTTAPLTSPTISVDANGKITATVTQSAGTTSGGTKTSTVQLSSDYDSDFTASNIKSGVSIFGVTGTYEGDGDSSLSNIDKVSVTEGSWVSSLTIQTNRSTTPSAIYIKNTNPPSAPPNSYKSALVRAVCDVYNETASGFDVEITELEIDTNVTAYADDSTTEPVASGNILCCDNTTTFKEYKPVSFTIYTTKSTNSSGNQVITITYSATAISVEYSGDNACFWGVYDIYLIYD